MQHGSTADSDKEGHTEHDIIKKAAGLIEAGNYAHCISLIDEHRPGDTSSQLQTLRLICQICIRSHEGQWWQVRSLWH